MAKKEGLWSEFKKFISRGNVVDMAIGVVVANAFKDIITKFTNGFISPIVGLITQGVVLSELKWILIPGVENAEGVVEGEVAFLWGAFVQSVIDFLIIAAVLFLILKIFTVVTHKAKELHISPSEREQMEKEAAEAKAKEEAEAAAAEAARLAAEQEEADKKSREIETVKLLREINESLKNR